MAGVQREFRQGGGSNAAQADRHSLERIDGRADDRVGGDAAGRMAEGGGGVRPPATWGVGTPMRRGQSCAYVSLDATGIMMQGPDGAKAEGRMVYVGMIYNPKPQIGGRGGVVRCRAASGRTLPGGAVRPGGVGPADASAGSCQVGNECGRPVDRAFGRGATAWRRSSTELPGAEKILDFSMGRRTWRRSPSTSAGHVGAAAGRVVSHTQARGRGADDPGAGAAGPQEDDGGGPQRARGRVLGYLRKNVEIGWTIPGTAQRLADRERGSGGPRARRW